MPRYAWNENDGGNFYANQLEANGQTIRVFLFGNELDGNSIECVDEERGYVTVAILDAEGSAFVNDEDEIVTVRLCGNVVALVVDKSHAKIPLAELTKEERELAMNNKWRRVIKFKDGSEWRGDKVAVRPKNTNPSVQSQ